MSEQISILTSYSEDLGATFIDESYQSVVMFLFISDWLGISEMVKTIYQKVAQQCNTPLKTYLINVSQNESTAQRYRVSRLPTTIIFKNGEIIDKFEGVLKKSDILKKIHHIDQLYRKQS